MLLRPAFEIQVGSSSVDSSTLETVDMAIRCSMDSAPGHFESSVKLPEEAGKIVKNDPVVVKLGYMQNKSKALSVVFTGKVDSIQTTGPKVMVMSPLSKLYRLRVPRSLNAQYASEIIMDLADEAKLEVEFAQNGIKFPSYVINTNKPAFEHMRELAILCGYDLYANNEGRLVFKEYQPSKPSIIEYGKNLLEIQIEDQTPQADLVKIAGSSPVGSKGEDKYYWMTKKDVEDKAGSGSIQMLIQNMAIKDPATAKAVAEASLKRLKAGKIVKLKVVGDEMIKLGDTVKIQKVPDDELNGEFQVREIEHVMATNEGFITNLTCRGESSK